MLSITRMFAPVDRRSHRVKRVSTHVSLYWQSKLHLLPCVLGCLHCFGPADVSMGRLSFGASDSLAFVFLVTLSSTNFFRGAVAGGQALDPHAAEAASYIRTSARSSRKKNSWENTTNSRRSSRDRNASAAVRKKDFENISPRGRTKAVVECVSPGGTRGYKQPIQSRKKTSNYLRRQEKLGREEERRKWREGIFKEMEELLSDSPAWRKLQAKRQAERDLLNYADEEGHFDVETSDAWKETYSKYQKQRKQKSALEIGAAASGTIGAAGLLGFLANRRQKKIHDPQESKTHRRSPWVLGAAGVVGLLGATASLLGRRHLKKMQRMSERRLVRMENEAYAGLLPRLKPTLGVDEISEEEKRKRSREERRRRRQTGGSST